MPILFKFLSAKVGFFFIHGAETSLLLGSIFLDSTATVLLNWSSAVVGLLLMDGNGAMRVVKEENSPSADVTVQVLRKPTRAFGSLLGNLAVKRKFDTEKIVKEEVKLEKIKSFTEKDSDTSKHSFSDFCKLRG